MAARPGKDPLGGVTEMNPLLQAIKIDEVARANTSCSKQAFRSLFTCPAFISDAANYVTRTFLAVRNVRTDTLNDLSLEHFFNRLIEFVIALAVLLSHSGWPLALTSTVFARACTGFMLVARLAVFGWERWSAFRSGRGWGDGADPATIANVVPGLLGFAAAWPAAAFVLVTMAESNGATIEAALTSFSVDELMLPIITGTAAEMVATIVVSLMNGVRQALGAVRSQQGAGSWGSVWKAGSRGTGVVLGRCLGTRLCSWYVGCTWAATWALLRDPGAGTSSPWWLLFQAWIFAAPALALAVSLVAAIGFLEAAGRAHALHSSIVRSGGPGTARWLADQGAPAVPPLLLAQRAARLRLVRSERWYMLVWTVGALLTGATSGALVLELRRQVQPMATAGATFDSAAAVMAATANVVDMDAYGPAASSPTTRIVGLWMGVHLALMVTLVGLAHALQDCWDAEDSQVIRSNALTDAQRKVLEDATGAASVSPALPAVLERVDDGRYRRTAEDVACRELGAQLITSPLHQIAGLQRAREVLRRKGGPTQMPGSWQAVDSKRKRGSVSWPIPSGRSLGAAAETELLPPDSYAREPSSVGAAAVDALETPARQLLPSHAGAGSSAFGLQQLLSAGAAGRPLVSGQAPFNIIHPGAADGVVAAQVAPGSVAPAPEQQPQPQHHWVASLFSSLTSSRSHSAQPPPVFALGAPPVPRTRARSVRVSGSGTPVVSAQSVGTDEQQAGAAPRSADNPPVPGSIASPFAQRGASVQPIAAVAATPSPRAVSPAAGRPSPIPATSTTTSRPAGKGAGDSPLFLASPAMKLRRDPGAYSFAAPFGEEDVAAWVERGMPAPAGGKPPPSLRKTPTAVEVDGQGVLVAARAGNGASGVSEIVIVGATRHSSSCSMDSMAASEVVLEGVGVAAAAGLLHKRASVTLSPGGSYSSLPLGRSTPSSFRGTSSGAAAARSGPPSQGGADSEAAAQSQSAATASVKSPWHAGESYAPLSGGPPGAHVVEVRSVVVVAATPPRGELGGMSGGAKMAPTQQQQPQPCHTLSGDRRYDSWTGTVGPATAAATFATTTTSTAGGLVFGPAALDTFRAGAAGRHGPPFPLESIAENPSGLCSGAPSPGSALPCATGGHGAPHRRRRRSSVGGEDATAAATAAAAAAAGHHPTSKGRGHHHRGRAGSGDAHRRYSPTASSTATSTTSDYAVYAGGASRDSHFHAGSGENTHAASRAAGNASPRKAAAPMRCPSGLSQSAPASKSRSRRGSQEGARQAGSAGAVSVVNGFLRGVRSSALGGGGGEGRRHTAVLRSAPPALSGTKSSSRSRGSPNSAQDGSPELVTNPMYRTTPAPAQGRGRRLLRPHPPTYPKVSRPASQASAADNFNELSPRDEALSREVWTGPRREHPWQPASQQRPFIEESLRHVVSGMQLMQEARFAPRRLLNNGALHVSSAGQGPGTQWQSISSASPQLQGADSTAVSAATSLSPQHAAGGRPAPHSRSGTGGGGTLRLSDGLVNVTAALRRIASRVVLPYSPSHANLGSAMRGGSEHDQPGAISVEPSLASAEATSSAAAAASSPYGLQEGSAVPTIGTAMDMIQVVGSPPSPTGDHRNLEMGDLAVSHVSSPSLSSSLPSAPSSAATSGSPLHGNSFLRGVPGRAHSHAGGAIDAAHRWPGVAGTQLLAGAGTGISDAAGVVDHALRTLPITPSQARMVAAGRLLQQSKSEMVATRAATRARRSRQDAHPGDLLLASGVPLEVVTTIISGPAPAAPAIAAPLALASWPLSAASLGPESRSEAGRPSSCAHSAAGAEPPQETCFICFEAPGDAVFMDCGHSGVCLGCANTITHGHVNYTTGAVSGGSGTCPVCRAAVMHVLRIGPCVRSVDGRKLAQVLPAFYWSRAPTQAAADSVEDSE